MVGVPWWHDGMHCLLYPNLSADHDEICCEELSGALITQPAFCENAVYVITTGKLAYITYDALSRIILQQLTLTYACKLI